MRNGRLNGVNWPKADVEFGAAICMNSRDPVAITESSAFREFPYQAPWTKNPSEKLSPNGIAPNLGPSGGADPMPATVPLKSVPVRPTRVDRRYAELIKLSTNPLVRFTT